MSDLSHKKCEPCSGNTPKLKDTEINENLLKINEWLLNDKKEMIYKKFSFKNFKKTIFFVNKVSEIAELEKHHPDFSFGYNYCLIMIHTHAIKGLSVNDFILASKIDAISEI